MSGDVMPPSGRAELSIVVPTVGRDLLTRALTSIVACSPPAAQIVVVDQGNGAGARIATEIVPPWQLKVVSQPRLGIGAARDAGVRQARHDVVVMTDDDCTVQADWIVVAQLLAIRHPAAIITGRVLPGGNSPDIPSTITDTQTRDYTGSVRDNVIYPNNVILPRRQVLEVGGFDARFRLAAEDNDLCYRWLQAGGALWYEPRLTVWHHDWRTDEELRAMYRRYWHGQGLVYGKHLRLRDAAVLPFLGRDIASLARRPVGLLLGRRPQSIDPRTGGAGGLSRGLLTGLAWNPGTQGRDRGSDNDYPRT
ncbi:MAG TPA: glycosyltransferase family A protein [Solirubrobacteraceae bacterium]|jgi:GT2 family glycosyltransferase|nr:glycosyltransferase family A protein [Solirubrobacteraceae bacterium]